MISHSRERKRERPVQLFERHQRQQPGTDLVNLHQMSQNSKKSEKEENQKEAAEENESVFYHFQPFFDDWRRLREDENSNALCVF